MSDRVWKFALPAPDVKGRCFIQMPTDVQPLSVGLQGDEMVVWALVTPFYDQEGHGLATARRRFIVANTGDTVEQLPARSRFLGTVTSDNGIVWHVWDGDAGVAA